MVLWELAWILVGWISAGGTCAASGYFLQTDNSSGLYSTMSTYILVRIIAVPLHFHSELRTRLKFISWRIRLCGSCLLNWTRIQIQILNYLASWDLITRSFNLMILIYSLPVLQKKCQWWKRPLLTSNDTHYYDEIWGYNIYRRQFLYSNLLFISFLFSVFCYW